ncbi:FMN-dependent NADH-azoreductase [Brevirhabdus sp.]|uniref:FMN-dependent NADH-azoreductase n=1 Tax=Brevirhabdus sp. TaxID=2004514 RepID=UPI0040583D75
MSDSLNILRIDGSARIAGSVSRDLTDRITARFAGAAVTRRDLSQPLPLIDEAWVGANFTPAEARTEAQHDALALSQTLVEELRAADVLVIGLPVYNFSVPASFKAWIDLIARAGETFRYTEAGPEGLLTGKRAIVALASGGTELGSDIDFAGRYIKHILGFIGITQVEFIRADQLALDTEGTIAKAHSAVAQLAA